MLDIIVSVIGGVLALGTFLGAGIVHYVIARREENRK